METENKNLSPEQSLDLISSLIRQTQGNVSSSSFYFLLWGWVITLCNFGMYTLMQFTTPKYAALVWTITIPAWIVTMIYSARQGKSREVATHLDKIHMWLWIAMAITILPSWIFGAAINWRVNAIVLMPIGLATFVSGIIIRFKPLLFGGITFWIAGILCYVVSPIDQYLVGGVAVVFGYLMPGYMLKKAINNKMLKELDPLLHSQLRLGVMSILISSESAEFIYLKEKTNSTAGNLSVQLDKLSEAGYIGIEKSFNGKKPLTTCKITRKGIKAFDEYVTTLKDYIKK